MLPGIHNVVSARELFNPNPCRDMWESQQYSQAASCSQGSQHSSIELFSQTRSSQQIGNSFFDGWNSQQMNEEDSKKYYMKYMSKPPLIPDLDKLPPQHKSHTLKYKDFIEGQKKRAAERDEKDVLDNFITLLKDYTKEVRSALDSFKINMDLSLTEKADQMACAAEQSTSLILKLKEDLLENFSDLRKEIKETQLVKEEVSKQNETLAGQRMEIKMLRDQLEDYKERERRGVDKEASLLEREAKLLEKIREMSMQQQAFFNQGFGDNGLHADAVNSCPKPVVEQPQLLPTASAQICKQTNIPILAIRPNEPAPLTAQNFSHCSMARQPNDYPVPQPRSHGVSRQEFTAQPSRRLHHAPQLAEPASTTCEIMHPGSKEGSQESAHINPRVFCPSGFMHRAAGKVDISGRALQAAPIKAAVVPVQSVQSTLPMTTNVSGASANSLSIPCIVTSAVHEISESTLTSPSGRPELSFSARNGRKKQSPVATVLPQVQVKEQHLLNIKKEVLSPEARVKDDPLDIFMFDLTNDSQHTDYTNGKQPEEKKEQPVHLATHSPEESEGLVGPQRYHTRSKQRVDGSTGPVYRDKVLSLQETRVDNLVNSTADKVYKVEPRRALKRTSSFDDSETDSEDELTVCESSFSKPGDRGSTTSKNIKRPLVRKAAAASKEKRSFSRNVTSRRTLAFNPSAFDLTENDTDIQQISECIRRHAQQKKMSKRTSM